MAQIKKYVTSYCRRAGILQKDFAKSIGIQPNTFSQYVNNSRQPDEQSLIKIAEALNVSIDKLLGAKISETHGVKIPVYGNVAAGIPIEAITDIEDYEEIPEDMAALGEYFALKIHGNSMMPRMSDGDVVIVRVQEDVDSGDIGIVMINGDSATCKKIKKTPDGILLISINPEYEPMYYSNNDIARLPVHILGKVVELRAKF